MRKKLVGALLCASMTAGLLAGTTTVYAGASKALEAGNVYCPWNEWGTAAPAHETYGTEMQSYLLEEQDLSTTLQNVDTAVAELLEK